MNKTKINLLLSVATTAVISTGMAFLLFLQFIPTTETVIKEAPLAKLTNYDRAALTNISPTTLLNDFVTPSARVTPAVVNIFSKEDNFRGSTGSGVVISSDGYIITNHHVVDGGRSFNVTFNNNRELRAEVVGTDPTTDIALLKVDARGLQTVEFGDSDNVQVGEWVLAVGNPFNLESTVTAGIVSAKGRSIDIIDGNYSIESFIQTDAVVNVGNSGGALVNTRGELIGINTAILTKTGGYEGYSFAVPANLVRKVISDLKSYGEVKRAILGVLISEVNNERANDLGLRDVSGVLITEVNSNSSAERADLREGDVIVSVNGRETGTMAALQEQIARYRPDDLVSIDFIRRGKKYRKDNVRLQGIR